MVHYLMTHPHPLPVISALLWSLKVGLVTEGGTPAETSGNLNAVSYEKCLPVIQDEIQSRTIRPVGLLRESVVKFRSLQVGRRVTLQVGRRVTLQVGRRVTLQVGRRVTLQVGRRVTLQVGGCWWMKKGKAPGE